MAIELNRIYQGRVKQVKIIDENSNPSVVADGDELLFIHHSLFQDAVNYYLVALAAMALDSEDSLFGKIKTQIRAVWNDFYRNGQLRQGLKHSIIRAIGHAERLNSSEGADEAMRLILDNKEINPEILNDALEQIAEQCKGNVTQPGNENFPRLCIKDTTANYTFDKKALAEAKGKQKLINALYAQDSIGEIQKLAKDIEIGWGGIKTQTGKFFTGNEAKESLKDAISYFLAPNEFSPKIQDFFAKEGRHPLEQYLQRIDQLQEIRFGRNNKARPDLRNAMWILKFFPDKYSIGLIKCLIPHEENATAGNIPRWGDDPVKLSRGSRGYVFKAFTQLPIWKESWKEFDMAAFREALKTINQFRDKTQSRNDELKKYCDAVNWMEGKSTATKPPTAPEDVDAVDEDEPNTLPVLEGDKRWDALLQLQRELGISNDFTENELMDYGLSGRTIRGFRQLRTRLLEKEETMRQKSKSDAEISNALLEVVKNFQKKNHEGSAMLFQKLVTPEYFCIWHPCAENQKFASADILTDAMRYYSYKEECAHMEEPIQITPADARFSRRTNNLRELVYSANGYKKGFGFSLKDKDTIALQIARETPNGITPCKVFVSFSAPRLKRDGLIGKDFSVYYPPALQAVFKEDEIDEQNFQATAAILMPDWDKNGKRRILLNFPVKLDIAKIHQNANPRFNKDQFYYANNVNACLLWPSYYPKKTVDWYRDTKPFDIVAVDLGQRSAGALSRISISTEKRDHSIPIGETDGNRWYAYRKYSELLRLPGEDAVVIRNGKRQREFSGYEGRLATDAETKDACSLCTTLIGNSTLLLGSDEKTIRSFPKQNDKLLFALRCATKQIKQLQRWLWMLNEKELSPKAQTEIAQCEWLNDKTSNAIAKEERRLRPLLISALEQIADRILPLRGRKWEWAVLPETKSFVLRQTAPGTDDLHKKICGQRGLSFARIEQLEKLRMRCQALNRILMRSAGERPATLAQMRNMPIPDCCPDILMRLDALKEQRVNQTANMILAQALGVQHRIHQTPAKERAEDGIHGEYEKIPGVEPAAFIVLENLSRYRFSQDRSRDENSRLMKWSHRQILGKLKLLCEVFAIPILEVNAAYSSKFSANVIPGFRAEECSLDQLSARPWNNLQDDVRKEGLVSQIRNIGLRLREIDPNATVVMPRVGGPVFIPFAPADAKDTLIQADINASFNIGLRGVADATDLLRNNRISCEYKKGLWQVKKNSEFAKKVYTKDISIDFIPERSLDKSGGNFFVIGCPDSIWNTSTEKRPAFSSAETAEKYPYLMFGSALWRDLLLQLERCRKINQYRLNRLIAKKETKNEF